MIFFWILWIIDALVALIAAWFFIIGLGDGSVSSFNITLWLAILIILAVVLYGSIHLKKKGLYIPAKILLALLAVPALLFGLFFLAAVFSGARWN